jgi:hypothetical protein
MSLPVTLTTPQSKVLLGSSTDATPAAHAFPDATTTEPSSDEANGVIVVEAPKLRNLMNFWFFGTDAANEQLDILIIRWYRKVAAAGGENYLWIPQAVASIVDATLGAATGASGEIPSNTHFFVDSISSIEIDTANRQTALTDPADTTWGLVIDTFGCQKIEVQFQAGTSAAAKGNFLYIGD